MRIRSMSLVAFTAALAGTVGGVAGYAAAQSSLQWPKVSYVPTNNMGKYNITPDKLKAIQLTATQVNYWFVDDKTGKQAVIGVPVSRILVGQTQQ